MKSVTPRILAVATALPRHRLSQAAAKRFAARIFSGSFPDLQRRLRVFDHAGVEERKIAMPIRWFDAPRGFAERNAAYRRVALELAERAVRRCLQRAGLPARAVDHVVLVSTTGLSTPSLDAHLINRLRFRSDVQRTPIWGLGCAGGAAGVSRSALLARSTPGSRILLVAVELCSLNFRHDDRSMTQLVGTSLFGDGAAAVLISTEGKGIEILASRSHTWLRTLDVTGWEVGDQGFKLLLLPSIPALVRDRAAPAVLAFLKSEDVPCSRVLHLVLHPGGPRILETYARALRLPRERLAYAREVLRSCGNMSSPSSLFVLERTMGDPAVKRGDLGLLSAVGPGFTSEMSLLRF